MGEHPESDAFIELVNHFGLNLICFSSKKFMPELLQAGKTDPARLEEWREKYDLEVYRRLEGFVHDIITLAGYMLIVSPMLCERYNMVNLHPAKPDGPKGTWQEVIWELIKTRAEETGVMMHLVTKELDRGPPITYCTFPIREGKFTEPLSELEAILKKQTLGEIQEEFDESEPYFALVREEGVKRELPLIILTLKAMADGKVRIKSKKIFDGDSEVFGGYSLTEEIEAYLISKMNIDVKM
jgi:phosphoribosylglycinamide formyltransferase-1